MYAMPRRRGRPAKNKCYCRHKNCPRRRRHPSAYCCRHSQENADTAPLAAFPGTAQERACRSVVKKKASSREHRPLAEGFFSGPLDVINVTGFNAVASNTRKFLESMNAEEQIRRRTGCRRVYVRSPSGLNPDYHLRGRGRAAFLSSLTTLSEHALSLHKGKLPCPVGKPVIGNIAVVVAPAASPRSNSHSTVEAHADFPDFEEGKGVLTFLLFIDAIDESSGTVKMWPGSLGMNLYQSKNRPREINAARLREVRLVGGPGALFIWDGRLVHQSVANGSDRETVRVTWSVVPEDWGGELVYTASLET